MYSPTRSEFAELARRGNLVPVYRELPADLDTPVSIYLKLRGAGASFLLESVEGGEQLARYSFLSADPAELVTFGSGEVTVQRGAEHETIDLNGQDPLDVLGRLLGRTCAVPIPGLPRFFGGAVGFFGYDFMRHLERMPVDRRPADFPDGMFMLTDSVIAFDHVKHRLLLIANAHIKGDPEAAYDRAVETIERLADRLQQPMRRVARPTQADGGGPLRSNVTPDEFQTMVQQAREHIAAGDIFQVVLSQRFERTTRADALSIYRALRRLNPSPYMFFLDLGTLQMIGSSPEALVRLENGTAQLNPIAGTRPRGVGESEDKRLEQELTEDPKERAEHVMLVDLGRNDLGRVCEYGSVKVSRLMQVERYSHVMHLVSQVTGRLRPDLDGFDLLRACFPAGTVSGAPKVRAMELIQELETTRRGPYAGAVGYFCYPQEKGLNLDFCITIRTIVKRGETAYLQAGAGIVADSDPIGEHEECVNKARALAEAIRLAEENTGGASLC